MSSASTRPFTMATVGSRPAVLLRAVPTRGSSPLFLPLSIPSAPIPSPLVRLMTAAGALGPPVFGPPRPTSRPRWALIAVLPLVEFLFGPLQLATWLAIAMRSHSSQTPHVSSLPSEFSFFLSTFEISRLTISSSLPSDKDDEALEAAVTRVFADYGTVFVKIRHCSNMIIAFAQYTVGSTPFPSCFSSY